MNPPVPESHRVFAKSDANAPPLRPGLEPHSTDATEAASGPSVLCGACGARITRVSDAIAIDGQHTHVCINPSGISFDIACYRQADGCREVGDAEAFWSSVHGVIACVSGSRACEQTAQTYDREIDEAADAPGRGATFGVHHVYG